MIQEDGTTESRAQMVKLGRDGSIWRFRLKKGGGGVGVDLDSARRVVELNAPGRDGVPVGRGVWETSGIIDVARFFGEDTWLFDVQAHGPTAAPAPNTVEDGQLLLVKRKPRFRGFGAFTRDRLEAEAETEAGIGPSLP